MFAWEIRDQVTLLLVKKLFLQLKLFSSGSGVNVLLYKEVQNFNFSHIKFIKTYRGNFERKFDLKSFY